MPALPFLDERLGWETLWERSHAGHEAAFGLSVQLQVPSIKVPQNTESYNLYEKTETTQVFRHKKKILAAANTNCKTFTCGVQTRAWWAAVGTVGSAEPGSPWHWEVGVSSAAGDLRGGDQLPGEEWTLRPRGSEGGSQCKAGPGWIVH